MAFQLSPGVLVTEEDRTTIVPSVATSAGAFAGAFQWGPVDQVLTIDSENTLVQRFGRPNDTNAGYFFTAANFLSYGNNLQVVRAVDKSLSQNAVSSPSGSVNTVTIGTSPTGLTSIENWTASFSAPDLSTGTTAQGTPFLSSTGSLIDISLQDSGFGYSVVPNVILQGGGGTGASASASLQFGRVVFAVLTSQGNNYTSASNVVFSGGGGVGATGELDVRYSVTNITIDDGGTNYQNTTQMIAVADESTSLQLSPVIGYPLLDVLVTSANVDIDTTAGNVGINVIAVNRGSGATATPVVGFPLDYIQMTSPGLNYFASNVEITFEGGGGSGATATANIDANGAITAIDITNPGSGYTSAPNVVIARNDAANVGSALAAATAELSTTGRLKDIIVTNSGSNYDQVPTVVATLDGDAISGITLTPVMSSNGSIVAATIVENDFALTDESNLRIVINRNNGNVGDQAYANAQIGYGRVVGITVTNQGNNYTSPPNVIINRNNLLGGSNAAAVTRVEYEIADIQIINSGTGYTSPPNVLIVPNFGDNPSRDARATSSLGFTIGGVNITEPGLGYTSAPTVTVENIVAGLSATATATIRTKSVLITNEENYDAIYSNGGLLFGEFAAKYPGELGNSIKVSYADYNTFDTWEYRNQFDSKPDTSPWGRDKNALYDELHIIVIDSTGAWTGVVNGVLEKFSFVSKASDAKNTDGSTNYYKDVINNQSSYIWWMNHPSVGTNWGRTSVNTVFDALNTPNVTVTLGGGTDGDTLSLGNISTAYNIFSNDEAYDISLMVMGPTTDIGVVNTAIGIAESRRDVLVFSSPPLNSVLNSLNAVTNTIAHRNSLTSSSFAVLDSGWKYQYDRYNDKYRYVPLNGDIAGLAARTDYLADPWFSPAGYNRGVIKNVVKLPFSPSKTQRDELYKRGINPIVTFPGQGTVLFGDKTLLARPSAFDRINVRRLFIVLEKAIATAAKFQLFEFNDAFTRAQFRNLVEPFLRDVQGRRGITDFRVICDETNNTAEVIDRNEFVADIFIKPARAINFIQLNFVASRSNVSFEEVGA